MPNKTGKNGLKFPNTLFLYGIIAQNLKLQTQFWK